MGAHDFPKILGTATLNEKGQLVIPVEARNNLGLTPGSRVVILSGMHRPALVLVKAEEVEAMVQEFVAALNSPEDKS